MCEVFILLALFTAVCVIFPQHHANSDVIMEDVDQVATGVMVMITVETTVMKMDVIVQVCICMVYILMGK